MSGTTNRLGKFTGATSMGDSLILDNGTAVSMGSNSPDPLHFFYSWNKQLTASGDGQSAIYGFRTRDSQNDGLGYGNAVTNAAVRGHNFWGDLYSFGVVGTSYNDYTRTGGVLGGEVSGAYWGSLGYKSSAGQTYGVYGNSANAYTNGTGRMTSATATGIGGGFHGDFMGGWVRGDVMGLVSSGQMFASYAQGNAYTTGKHVELVRTEGGKVAPAFSVTATESKIYADGKAALKRGRVRVTFEQAYAGLLDKGEVPSVTVSPVGGWANLYIESVDRTGFTVAEANGGRSGTAFNWIAIGKRVGTGAQVPAELLDGQLDAKLDGLMFDEGLTKQSGKSLWWDGQQLRTSTPPSATPKRPDGARR